MHSCVQTTCEQIGALHTAQDSETQDQSSAIWANPPGSRCVIRKAGLYARYKDAAFPLSFCLECFSSAHKEHKEGPQTATILHAALAQLFLQFTSFHRRHVSSQLVAQNGFHGALQLLVAAFVWDQIASAIACSPQALMRI